MKTTADAMRMHNSLRAGQKNKKGFLPIYTIEMWKEESTPQGVFKRVRKKTKTRKVQSQESQKWNKYSVISNAKVGRR